MASMYAVNLSSTLGSASPFFISESSADSYSNFPPFNTGDSNDQLADKITTLAGQINAATYRFIKMIAEFDRRKAWEGPGIRSCAYWLAWKSGLDITVAREKVRVAKALDGLPKTNAAFEKGELSYSKVRAMTRVATEKNESYLLDIAQYGTTQHVVKLAGAFRTVTRVEDFDGADAISVMGELDESVVVSEHELDLRREQTLYESRGVSCYQDDEGMWIIKAKLPAEEGALLVKVIKELGDRLAEKVAADAFSEYKKDDCLDEKLLKEVNLTSPQLSFPQRRADALAMMAEDFLARTADDNGGASSPALKGAERCQLVLHVQSGHVDHGQDSNLEGRWLLPDVARRLACDASLLVVEQDSVGNVLNIGRKTRIISAAMSRALAIRDGGCQFPGCCESRYVEGHHVKHWADGGETKLDNLVTLCRYHHRELHRGKFFLAVKPLCREDKFKESVRFADRLCFSTVDRYFDAPFNRPPLRSKEDQVIARNPAKFTCACCGFDELEKTLSLSIDKNTAVTKWLGEGMDLGMAVEGLLWASGRVV
ncbi:MAG: hypothetical protein ACI9NY_002347 [Kiritimatiellia bacterium]